MESIKESICKTKSVLADWNIINKNENNIKLEIDDTSCTSNDILINSSSKMSIDINKLNTIDKLNGSKELIKKLVEFKSVSLIATHDLKLSEMENEFPQQVFNKCFEIRIEKEELVFDYKLTDGATKTMNATFLMKKMGII